jgi:hypothetical protein
MASPRSSATSHIAKNRGHHDHREIVQERDHPKQVSLEHDWVVMGSLDGDGRRVPEGEAGQQVPAAQPLQGPKMHRDAADATPIQR